MRLSWIRCQKWCVALSLGGITLGIVQGFNLVNFASLFANFLASFFALLVSLLLGGSASNNLLGSGTGNLTGTF